MRPFISHLYWTPDTCSVYLLRDGDSSLLIDCGTDLRPQSLTDRLDDYPTVFAAARKGLKVVITL